jgi:hypothetical protein
MQLRNEEQRQGSLQARFGARNKALLSEGRWRARTRRLRAVTHKSGLPSETCQIRSQGYQGPGSDGAAEGAGVGSGAA